MTFQPATPASVSAFLATCGFVLVALLAGIWRSARLDGQNPPRRTALVAGLAALWLGLAAAIVQSGWLSADPRRLPLFLGVILLGSGAAGMTTIGRWLAACPLWALLGFQGFRFPLELILHSWVQQGVIPETMTWTGSNWDVIAGMMAWFFAPRIKHATAKRQLALSWAGNLIGWILLLNVMRVALRSAPGPIGWPNVQPKLLLPFHLPYALIVPICVGGALIGQIALTRALLARKQAGE